MLRGPEYDSTDSCRGRSNDSSNSSAGGRGGQRRATLAPGGSSVHGAVLNTGLCTPSANYQQGVEVAQLSTGDTVRGENKPLFGSVY